MLRPYVSLAFLVFLFAAITIGLRNTEPAHADEPAPFAKFVDEYFDAYFARKPSEGTAAGLHQYDDKLEDYSAAVTKARIAEVKKLHGRLETLRAGKLTEDESIDAEFLDGLMKAELLDLDVVGNWKKNPMGYISLPPGAIDGLMKRNFAPPHDRLKSIIARLKATPATFAALKANIDNPPKEFTDLAIRMGEGSIEFYQTSVKDWAKEAAGKDEALFKEFDAANTAVVKAFEEIVAWMKKDLLPRSKGSFALGADTFMKQLRYEELLDIPLDKLLAIGEANLQRDQQAFTDVAKRIDPKKSPKEVMDALSDEHPTEADLIPSGRRTIEKCRQFLIDKHIVTVPSKVLPTVEETPSYARDGTYASMDTPGAYEKKATEAFYYITPTEKDWTPKHKEEHLRLFNFAVMQVVTIHEAFPGHYIQFLYAKQYPTKTRKLTYCGSNVEGWAHYCEQMTIEKGYGDGDPKLRLAQLSEALLRDCRYVVGIKMHTQGMTVEEGAKVFEKEGHQAYSTGFEEARRGAYNPTYLYYTLGKLQIYKLRDDYQRMKGADYDMERFHTDFVRQGGLPIKLIRRIMLPGDKGPTL